MPELSPMIARLEKIKAMAADSLAVADQESEHLLAIKLDDVLACVSERLVILGASTSDNRPRP
jgi:hypothetical protein